MGTRSRGDAGVYSGKRETAKEVSALGQGLKEHLGVNALARLAIGTIAASNPMIGGITLGAEIAYSAYKGLSIYKETGDIKKSLSAAGIEAAKTLAEDMTIKIGLRTASDFIVPGLISKFAGTNANTEQIRNSTKIIRSAIEGAVGEIT